MSLSSFFEILLYVLVGAYSAYASLFVLNLGFTLFACGAILLCFVMSCWSIFRMLLKPHK